MIISGFLSNDSLVNLQKQPDNINKNTDKIDMRAPVRPMPTFDLLSDY